MNAESTLTDRTGRAERADNRSRDCEVRNIQKEDTQLMLTLNRKTRGRTQMTHKTDKHTFC